MVWKVERKSLVRQGFRQLQGMRGVVGICMGCLLDNGGLIACGVAVDFQVWAAGSRACPVGRRHTGWTRAPWPVRTLAGAAR